MDQGSVRTKWAAIKDRSGRITGYIELFRTSDNKWVTVPDASGFRETLPEDAANEH